MNTGTGDRMSNDPGAWEEEYARRGVLWGGAVHHLPPLQAGARVLELGCGNGKTLSAMIQRGWAVTAIDLSPRAVEMSRAITGRLQSGDTCLADARRLPFAPMTFDAVFAIHILSHLQKNDRTRTAAESERVLKKGGILYFSGFSTDDFRAGTGCTTEPGTVRRGTGISTHYFTEPETQDLFCRFHRELILTHRWSMQVRGQALTRAEVQATFIK